MEENLKKGGAKMVEKLDDEKQPAIVEDPTAKLPTVAQMKGKKLFRCKNCSTEAEGQVWWSWDEALKEPTAGQDPEKIRTLLKCPTCKGSLGINSLEAKVDVTALPKELQ
jgi:hypothetical protein